MAKIECIGHWNAHAALHAALEESNPDDKVFVFVRTKDDQVTKYFSNYKNMELYWDCALMQEDILYSRREK